MNSICRITGEVKPLAAEFAWVHGAESGRVRDCLLFATGRLGVAIADAVIGMLDDDGILIVETTRNLRLGEEIAFRDAWEKIGYQSRENVHFTSLENQQSPLLLSSSPMSIMASSRGRRAPI